MARHRAVLVSAIAATVVPVLSAYAADSVSVAQPNDTGALEQHFRPALPQPSTAPGIRLERRQGGLRFDTEGASTLSRPEDYRYGFAGGTAASSALRLSPAISAPKTGWQFSGRVGPLRWLTPLDGDGDTTVRFGGRVPGQPRMPGMGLFNVGVHYTFE